MKRSAVFFSLIILVLDLSAQPQLKITTANINFRSTPSIENNIICVIPAKTLLLIDYENQLYEDWIKTQYHGKTGYVFTKYLKTPVTGNNYTLSGEDQKSDNNTKVKYYTNTRGEKVQSPTYYKSPPAGATAECRDGTYSFSKSRRGTCSHHGGVKRWL